MKSLQLKNIQNQIESLKKNSKLFPNDIQIINNDEYLIRLSIIPEFFENLFKILKNKIEFVIHLGHNYPFNPPKIYVLNKIEKCFLCDCRDLLYDIINKKIWKNNQFNLIDIINLIPDFLIKISNENYIKKSIGNYYLDEEYNYYLINETEKLYYGEINEEIKMNNSNIFEKKFLFISEEYLLIFISNIEFNNFILNQLNTKNNNLKLIFYANFKSIDYIKKLNENIQINFKIKNNKIYKLQFSSIESEIVFNIIMEMLQKNKINYSVTSKNNDNNKKIIEKNQAEELEEKIVKIERKFIKDNNLNINEIKSLIDYYEIIINYYNSKKDKREEEYIIKLNKIKNNEIIKNILNEDIKKIETNINNNDEELKKDINNINEKKLIINNKQLTNLDDNNNNSNNNNNNVNNNENNVNNNNENNANNNNENNIINDNNDNNIKIKDIEIEKDNLIQNKRIENNNTINEKNNNIKEETEDKKESKETIKLNVNKNDLNLNFDDED